MINNRGKLVKFWIYPSGRHYLLSPQMSFKNSIIYLGKHMICCA